MIPYKKRIETQTERKAWIPKEIDQEFRKVVTNYQAWVLSKMKEEIEKGETK